MTTAQTHQNHPPTAAMVNLDLRGKEYFSLAEAAHYCCCSPSQFRRKADGYGIYAAKRFGRIVYRRADCQAYMESAFIEDY